MYDVLEPYKLGSGDLRSVWAHPESLELVLNTAANNSISFRIDPDDDTLWLNDGPRREVGIDVSASSVWQDFIGKTITYGWLSMNQNGYIDCALLGFDRAIPDVCVSVAASELKVSRLDTWRAAASE
jgi:hypothetical protein